MTLKQFAVAVGADTKWIKNAIAALGLSRSYGIEEACRLGLARVIHRTSGIPLKGAYEVACTILANHAAGQHVIAEAADRSVQVTVDLPRYLSTFHTRLALAQRQRDLRRGRPPRPHPDPIRFAQEYGIDVSLLQSHLQRTPDERLRIGSANAEFIRQFRGTAAR